MKTALFVSFLLGVAALPAQDREFGSAVKTTLTQVRQDPEAYKNVDSRMLTLPPARSLTAVAIAAIGMLAVVVVAYFALFTRASGDLRDTLQKIQNASASDGKSNENSGGAK